MHRRIYDAIERGDPDGARKAMSAHIASALGTLVDAMPDGAADGGSS
jgi:DNA-binding FadR family transcriptional regulator